MVQTTLTRRSLVSLLGAATAFQILPAAAQTPAAAGQNGQIPGMPAKFGYDDVVKRAQDLSSAPFDATIPPLPPALEKLDFDAWRDIRFRPEKALLAGSGGQFQVQTFHLGHLYKRPVTINTIRDGIVTPIPYSASLFDYGKTKFDKPLPVNLGFAGFRVHYPLNMPKVWDELISFLGASYFRFLGRDQQYGLSARGLGIGTGLLDGHEEFPFFREFWFDTPEANADRLTLYALLDSPSTTGAYRFDVYPSNETAVDINVTLFPRKQIVNIGLAPLTSMFFVGENDRHLNDRNRYDDYREELHDSDGLLIHSSTGEWIWRPLQNPQIQQVSYFDANNVRGFGLMQRDRSFNTYQDLELAYQSRPSYWIEPHGDWGDGRVELVELSTNSETADNIIASWIPNAPVEPGKALTYSYKITAMLDDKRMVPGGHTEHTFTAPARALGSKDPPTPGSRRFLIDFAGGDLDYFSKTPEMVELVPSTTNGTVTGSFLVSNPQINGLRAAFDIDLPVGETTVVRAFLRSGNRALTETWTYRWTVDQL
ncbi:glucan biosynthesis protein [Methylovirgula sp. 4M-Z18]|uniref:glucan biosynthesis protein n=1 Tax=Methylovirgula sp. 4M-Z18 TaxID=2293567 RepID=UPI000E2F9ECF|nr:glucan biosynthesis protein G [Methylovirgula sp. 4M-Z18]RFB78011.1 glucan biosynthesis protein G [Methylovirgula sp. 4M-Z18]